MGQVKNYDDKIKICLILLRDVAMITRNVYSFQLATANIPSFAAISLARTGIEAIASRAGQGQGIMGHRSLIHSRVPAITTIALLSAP